MSGGRILKQIDKTCAEFLDALSSKAAVPGGGGAAALAGSIGTALASMVCNLTLGKKKYAQYEEEIQRIIKESTKLQYELLKMVDEDAGNFLPLSKAYGMPANTDEEKIQKERIMQLALKAACATPVKIVRTCFFAIKLHEELIDKCTKLAISDVGVGVQCLRAAIISAELNVIININMISDDEYVNSIREETEKLVKDGVKVADKVYEKVVKMLRDK